MKNIINFLIFVAIAGVAYYYISSQSPVTNEQFQTEIDSIKEELEYIESLVDELEYDSDTLKNAVKELKADTDTIKAGQRVIYKKVDNSDNSESSFLQTLNDFLK